MKTLTSDQIHIVVLLSEFAGDRWAEFLAFAADFGSSVTEEELEAFDEFLHS